MLTNSVRPKRDFRPQQLYAITQRGNQGQWVYRDAEDFEQALIHQGSVSRDRSQKPSYPDLGKVQL